MKMVLYHLRIFVQGSNHLRSGLSLGVISDDKIIELNKGNLILLSTEFFIQIQILILSKWAFLGTFIIWVLSRGFISPTYIHSKMPPCLESL